jgi:Na+/H+ antiporter NhaD/arsenite permease-like protein
MTDALALWLTVGLFAATYVALAVGRIPGLRIDRAGIALVGATLMLVSGVVSFPEAVSPETIDYKTLAVLFGMMVVVGFVRLSGLLGRLARPAVERIASPRFLLAATIVVSGVLSAFFINDIVCLALTPLVLRLARRLRFDPVPHLIALATAANIGSTGTITGNPQNIYIGSHAGIAYLWFAARLLPVAVLGLMLNYAVVALVYRQQLAAPIGPARQHRLARPAAQDTRLRHSRGHFSVGLQWKSGVVALAAVALFFAGLPLELVALGAAALLLLGRTTPDHVYRRIDWSLLVMFVGLFVVVRAFEVHVVEHWHIQRWGWFQSRPVGLLSLVTAGLSNLVSNVPAVLVMGPLLNAVPAAGRETAWLALAMSSTLAGNLTVLGSVANLIVLENGGREGVRISLWEYCKVGVPLTVLTLTAGIVWLELVRY